MIITLTGENDFGLQRELRKLAETFTKQHSDLALERLDGEEAGFGQLREAATSLPFLADKKLVILRQPSKNKQFAEQAEQIFDDLPDTNDIILIEPKLDKRLSYYKLLKKQTDFREFSELDQHAVANWLSASAKERGGKLSSTDARYLVERVGANQQLLSNELEKLLLYSSTVDKGTIDLLTDPTPQSTIFQLLEAAFAGNGKKTLQLYAEQRALKVEPAQIIAMLAWQLHVLAIIKTAGGQSPDTIAKEAKLNPFVVRKSQGIARQVSLPELRLLIRRLLKIDVAIKSTDTDADEALQNYLLALG